MSTIYDPRYEQLITALVNARTERNITQVMLAERLGQHQSYIAKVEGLERRLDVIELFDWLQGLGYEPQRFFQDIGWFPRNGKVIPLPLRNQDIIYRLYLREYKKSTPEQSWVRAGGEAVELFIERRYSSILKNSGIRLRALISAKDKGQALREMGLAGKVGDSKLDVALYGYHNNQWVIFGGVHSKASLAERVSDDVPCSEAMMRNGLASFLYTFDSKSFPPPVGDLVNRGELGSINQPSDKRKYIEEHGSFDACFSYNLRSVPSPEVTSSGKRIFVCSLKPEGDVFPSQVIDAWERYKADL